MEVESLTELFRFFSKNEDLLYVGDDELLPLACDNSKKVVYICPEHSGYNALNLKIVKANPLSSDIEEKGPFDSLINNLSVDIMHSFQAMERLLPLLKENARILLRIEPHGRTARDLEIVLDALLHDYSLKIVDELDIDKKKYMILEKIHSI